MHELHKLKIGGIVEMSREEEEEDIRETLREEKLENFILNLNFSLLIPDPDRGRDEEREVSLISIAYSNLSLSFSLIALSFYSLYYSPSLYTFKFIPTFY